MPSTDSELRAELATALNRLDERLALLDTRLAAERRYPVWVWQTDPAQARTQARAVIRAVDYIDGQEPKAARICPGLIGASAGTLAAARAVNQAKQELETVLAAMRGRVLLIANPDGPGDLRVDLVKHALAVMKRPRFHHKQATRQLVVLDRPPDSVRYIWARCAKIRRRSRQAVEAELRRRLQDEVSPRLLDDLERVQALPPGEDLAEVRPPHVHPRANITLEGEEGTVRLQRRAVLPILYPAAPGERLPCYRPLPDQPPEPGQNKPRADIAVARERYLETMPVHRYRTVP